VVKSAGLNKFSYPQVPGSIKNASALLDVLVQAVEKRALERNQSVHGKPNALGLKTFSLGLRTLVTFYQPEKLENGKNWRFWCKHNHFEVL